LTAPPTEFERLVAACARELVDGEVCFVGIGVPSLAAMLAKHTHAPDLVLIYESGAVDADPAYPPLSTGSPVVVERTAMLGTCLDVFAALQAGHIDVGLLSGAQVDRGGNLNSTVIGPYAHPKLRLVGSGGAHDIGCLARRVVIAMPHEPRRFTEHVDFVTTPGFPTGPTLGGRGRRGRDPRLPGGGPAALVTGRARFTFPDGDLTLQRLHHGGGADDAVAGLSWEVPRAPDLEEAPPLDPEVLDTLRRRVLPEADDLRKAAT
jgi:glutaconate CoA-transferase, subunit B